MKIMLSEEAIREYQEIYKKQYGKELSRAEALEQGTQLLHLFKNIYQPIPKKWVEELKERDKEKSNVIKAKKKKRLRHSVISTAAITIGTNMTNYNTNTQPILKQDTTSAKEQRKVVLDQVRRNRAKLYERLRKEGKIQ